MKPAIVAMPAQDLLAGFAARVLESPDKVALVAGEVSLSYADLDSILQVTGLAPPDPRRKHPTIALPTLDFLLAGPNPVVRAQNLARPYNSEAINRASIMFLMASNIADNGFKFLMTGDGYNVLPKLDVTGPSVGAPQYIDFLQVPHHGSIENSDQSLYRAYLAKHYLISSSYTAYKGAHPAVKVVQDIVAATTALGHSQFSIWINDPDLPANFALPPPGNYRVYRLETGENGGSFTYQTGQPIEEPKNYAILR